MDWPTVVLRLGLVLAGLLVLGVYVWLRVTRRWPPGRRVTGPGRRLVISMTLDAEARFIALQDRLGASETEMVQSALALYEFAAEAHDEGWELLVARGGVERQVAWFGDGESWLGVDGSSAMDESGGVSAWERIMDDDG